MLSLTTSLMTNSAQLTVLLVITRLELPSNAVSPALTTITETPALYSDCTVQGGGENIINIGATLQPPPSPPPHLIHQVGVMILYFIQPIVVPS